MSDDLELQPSDGPDEATLSEAHEQGWVPQEKWTGDPDKWTDAATFVEKGKRINTILNKTLKKKDEHIARLEADLASMKGTVKELADFQSNIEKKAYERALVDLKNQKAEALSSGDYALASRVDDAIDELKDQKPKEKKEEPKVEVKPGDVPPDVKKWIDDNSDWYNQSPKSRKLVAYANSVSALLIQEANEAGEAVVPSEILAKVKKEVQEQFPDQFKATPSMFDSGGSGGGVASKGKGFGSLPQDAKDQFSRFYSSGFYAGKDEKAAQAEYFKDYSA